MTTNYVITKQYKELITSSSINTLNYKNINKLDQNLMSSYNDNLESASDILLGSFILGSVFASPYIVNNKNEFVTLGIMYFEVLSINLGINMFAKYIVDRPRPLLYDTKLDNEEKLLNAQDNNMSFYSGHTTMAFATAFFISTVYSDLNSESNFIPIIWTGSMLCATGVATLRMTAGMHFFTDVITGAIISSAITYGIVKLHKKRKDSKLSISPNIGSSIGLSLTYKL